MTESQKLAAAVKNIARAYLFLHLNINLGTLNVLPSWVGYILIFGALPVIAEEQPSAKLLRPLAVILGLWEGVLWGAQLFNVPFEPLIPSLLAAVVGLYFHFQLLTDLANIAKKQHEYSLHTRLLTLRTVRTLMITVIVFPFPWEKYPAITMIFLIAHAIVALWICVVLYALRRSVLGEHTNNIIYCDTEEEQ
ncbi:MAG: hypothetical protein IKM48_05910 [Clostridia bacterium]|nr:hypothetical protein [Clostridia bacterium]